jgi:hypothetical protein
VIRVYDLFNTILTVLYVYGMNEIVRVFSEWHINQENIQWTKGKRSKDTSHDLHVIDPSTSTRLISYKEPHNSGEVK